MKPIESSGRPVDPQLAALARQQLADFDRRDPSTSFANGLPITLDEAYHLQALVAELRAERGEELIGYKVGCNSPTTRARLGIDHPVYGRLCASDRWQSGVSLASSRFARPAVEGELAVRLSQDLVAGDLSNERIWDSVEYLLPVIEMHNFVFRSRPPSVEELVANNAMHAGFVYSTVAKIPPPATPTMQIAINDETVANVASDELLAMVADSLRWLTTELGKVGRELPAGCTVLCGSVADLFPVEAPSSISVKIDQIASQPQTVECTISPTSPPQ